MKKGNSLATKTVILAGVMADSAGSAVRSETWYQAQLSSGSLPRPMSPRPRASRTRDCASLCDSVTVRRPIHIEGAQPLIHARHTPQGTNIQR